MQSQASEALFESNVYRGATPHEQLPCASRRDWIGNICSRGLHIQLTGPTRKPKSWPFVDVSLEKLKRSSCFGRALKVLTYRASGGSSQNGKVESQMAAGL
jgi:hypothetical protein